MPKILVLEDDPSLCDTIAEIIEREGHDVEACRTLPEAERVLVAEQSLWFALFDVEIRFEGTTQQSFHLVRTHCVEARRFPFAIKTANPEVIIPPDIDAVKLDLLSDTLDREVLRRLLQIVENHWAMQ